MAVSSPSTRAGGERPPADVHGRAGPRARSAGALPVWLKPLVFGAALLPLVRLIVYGLTDRLGANPIEFITRSTGLWTLIFLCIALAVTPVRRLTGYNGVARLRRMLGLFAFFYACLHFTTYFWLDQWFDVHSIAKDILKRPFITVGFATFVLLSILAATSPKVMVRRLGGQRWRQIHRVVYAAAALAILHFWWMKAGKHDLELPKIYGSVVLLLLGMRVYWAVRARRAATAVQAGSGG